eukprot:gene10315-11386_t
MKETDALLFQPRRFGNLTFSIFWKTFPAFFPAVSCKFNRFINKSVWLFKIVLRGPQIAIVILDELKSALKVNKEDILREINVKFTEIKMVIKLVMEVAPRADSQATKNEATILKLQAHVCALQADNKSLLESLDDQINRSLR